MPVRTADLYAGAGGLSTGLIAAGATISTAIDSDPDAVATYAANHPATEVILDDVPGSTPAVAERELSILAGGPPCQGWSTLGARSNRARRAKQNAAISVFLDQVEMLRPLAVMLENVRGLAVADGGRHLRRIVVRLAGLGYDPAVRLVRAAEFGVPQLRHRLFVVAVRRDLGIGYEFPPPINRVATVRDAIGDLPALRPGGRAEAYTRPPTTTLQRCLRGGVRRLTLHEAPAHPEHILRLLAALPKEGGRARDIPDVLKPTSGFHNTYARLRSDAPAPAVTSSIGRVSSGPHVHPRQARALTPREAARLQTFRDSYRWHGAGRWSIYRQIGNAVPPLLAESIARPLVAAIARVLGESATAEAA